MSVDEEKTFKKFGYYFTDLKPKSNKKIVVVCDNCGKERIVFKYNYSKLCRFCAHKGKKHSKEAKRKMSKAHIGKKLSEEHKEKISKSKCGKNGSMYGKHHSEKTKQKISIAKSGKNNSMYGKYCKESPGWKGGVANLPYCSKFNNKLKESIRKRDNHICQLCGKIQKSRRFDIHHIHYDKENCNPDLITLCRSCNIKVNFNRDYWERYFMRLLLYNNIKTEIYNIENELNIWNYGNF